MEQATLGVALTFRQLCQGGAASSQLVNGLRKKLWLLMVSTFEVFVSVIISVLLERGIIQKCVLTDFLFK